jgi:hypothetical protein
MEIKNGSTRLVVIFKNFVIKIPKVYWRRILKVVLYRNPKYFFLSVKKHGFKRHYLIWLIQKRESLKNGKKYIVKESERLHLQVIFPKAYEINWNLSFLFFSGVMANWNEFIFYRRAKNPFVMPTYFSFLGLINIQKRGKKIDFWGQGEVWRYVCKNCEYPNQPFCDSHTFIEIGNFCLDGERLKW